MLNINTTPMLKQYFDLQQKYTSKYGPNTVVFFEVGKFYECYSIDDPKIGDVHSISKLLNIQDTQKNKNKTNTHRNPHMLGFPNQSISKFIKILMENGYTVPKYDQKDIQNSDKKERVLDKIYSPGTYIDKELSSSNYIISIIFEPDFNVHINQNRSAYMSAIDLTTGKVKVLQISDTLDDRDHTENETFRFIHSHRPLEILIGINKVEIKVSDFINIFKTGEIPIHVQRIPNEYRTLAYQNQLLKKVYGSKKKDILSPIEHISLERYPELVLTFVFLLQFAYEHDHSIITRLSSPELIKNEESLVLNKDSIYQLNIIDVNKGSDRHNLNSIYNMVNFAHTNMGKRLLKERLLQPITNIDILNKRYDQVESLKPHYKDFEIILRDIIDLEKKHRKGILKRLSPFEFSNLIQSYDKVKQLFILTKKKLPSYYNESLDNKFLNFCRLYEDCFLIEKMREIYSIQNIKESIFKKGIYEHIDSLQEKINLIRTQFESTAKYFSQFADPRKPRDSVKFVYTENEGFHLWTTKTRYKRIQDMDNFDAKIQKNQIRFNTKKLQQSANECKEYQNEISEYAQKEYISTIFKLYLKNKNLLSKLISFIAELDVSVSSAKVSALFNHNRPLIKVNDKSFLEFKGIRHPLIELLIDEPYITNDVSLGHTHTLNKSNCGILLYSVNAAGKSSLLRAIGSNIILAQAGLFVSAERLTFSPFTLLFSKISSTDNLFKGHSTFVHEMNELRTILRGSNGRSLILADELCSGTESLSATSIVASTLIELKKRGALFMFATHLHSLLDLKEINTSEGLGIYHFKVHLQNEQIIYNRKLTSGQGDTLYGLEIAKSLDLGSDFIRKAFDIRLKLQRKSNLLLPTKHSRYNKKLYMDVCNECNLSEEKAGPLETHHIHFQSEADERGIVHDEDPFHKDKLINLMVLCKQCHINLHKRLNYKGKCKK